MFLFSLRFRLTGWIFSSLILFGTFSAICATNITSCLAVQCTMTNPVSIMFATLTGMYRMWIALSVMPICLYFVCLLNPLPSEAVARSVKDEAPVRP